MCYQPCARAREIHWGVQIWCPKDAQRRQILVEADEGEIEAMWPQHGGSTAPAECRRGVAWDQEVNPSIRSGEGEVQRSHHYSDVDDGERVEQQIQLL